MSQSQILGIIRHALTFAGGVIAYKGYASEETITEIVGCAMTLIGGIWSIVAKKK